MFSCVGSCTGSLSQQIYDSLLILQTMVFMIAPQTRRFSGFNGAKCTHSLSNGSVAANHIVLDLANRLFVKQGQSAEKKAVDTSDF
jgi:hypothetical protein